MNIEQFVNDYLQEHHHDVLLNPYNGLIDFANAFKGQMMKEAVEGLICATITGTNAISFLSPLPKELMAGDKVHIIVVKED